MRGLACALGILACAACATHPMGLGSPITHRPDPECIRQALLDHEGVLTAFAAEPAGARTASSPDGSDVLYFENDLGDAYLVVEPAVGHFELSVFFVDLDGAPPPLIRLARPRFVQGVLDSVAHCTLDPA